MQGNCLKHNRLNGLDTLRAIAIVIVLLYHYKVVVSRENTFGYLTQVGWMGVDLFFVLSGYLIGNQLLSAIANHDGFSLRNFYARRLLRTLPNYYVVLTLYMAIPLLSAGLTTAPLWQLLTFTQNFDFRPPTTFSHSWSLCIEEQFYLIFPLILLALAKSRAFLPLAWLTILAGMCLGVAARTYAWYSYGESAIDIRDYYQHIYYSSWTRFDELLPGVALALLKNFHPALFSRLLKRADLWFGLGVLLTGSLFYLFPHYHSSQAAGFHFLLSTQGYSWLAIGFACLTLAALSPQSVLGKVRIPGAAQLALWSYAIYLIHKPVFQLLIAPLTAIRVDVKAPLGVAVIMLLSVLAGWMLYRLVETPFMTLRGKYFPADLTTAAQAPAHLAKAG